VYTCISLLCAWQAVFSWDDLQLATTEEADEAAAAATEAAEALAAEATKAAEALAAAAADEAEASAPASVTVVVAVGAAPALPQKVSNAEMALARSSPERLHQ
jgi:hypothetical protein